MANRTGKGGQRKGEPSRNPSGRPPVVRHVVDLAREHTEDAIRTLAEIMKDPREKGPARVLAANSLLDRGYGKAPQTLNIKDRRDPGQLVARAREAIARYEAEQKGQVH